MVQKVPYTVSTGLNSQFKNIEETCSCTKCDSLFCFSKRHFLDSCSCSCNNCKESKTCLFFTNRLVRVNESRSDATSAAPISAPTSATGDNAHSYSKYTSPHKVESTKFNEAVITSKQPSKTLAIAHIQPSAITNKQPSSASELGQKVLGASETGIQPIYYSTQKKPYESSLNAIKKEVSEVKQSSCCIEQLQSAILAPESHSCGHHRSTEIHKVPEQISCVSQETKPHSSPGYVFDLTTYKSTNSRTDTCEVMCVDNNQSKTEKSSSAKNTEDYICDENAAECKLGKLGPDSPGFIINLKNKYPCDCNESSKDVSEPPQDQLDSSGYVLDLTEGSYKQTKNPLVTCKNIFTNKINAIKALCNTCLPQINPMICNEPASVCKSAKLVPDLPGNIFDVKNKKPCNCNELQEKSQTPCCKEDDRKKAKTTTARMSRGYVFDVPKPYDTYNKPKQKTCDCNNPKLVSDPPGYVYDFKQRLKFQRKTTCDCNLLPDNSSYPPGYVFIIPSQKSKDQSKHQPVKQSNSGEKLNLKLQRKTTCDCNLSPDNSSDPPGYEVIIPSQKSKDKSKYQTGKQPKSTETQKKKYLPGADPCSNCRENIPEPTNHRFNISVNGPGNPKKESLENQKNNCSCNDSHKTAPKLSKSISESQGPSAYKLELCKNILEIQKNAIETLDNLCHLQKKCCDFSTSQTEPPEIDTGQEYSQEPASIKQQLCANILKTQLNAVGILHDVTCAAHESMSCPCNDQQDHTKLFHSQKTSEKKQKFLINFLEANTNGFESLRSSYKNTSCECNNEDLSGYIIELNQSKDDASIKTNESTNNTSQKNKYDCEESRKRLSSSAGYILELDQYKHEAVNKTRKLSKTIFELQNNAVETLTNECQLKNCDNRKRLSSSAGYILELDQYKHDPMNRTQKLSTNLFDVQRNTIESLNNTNLKKSYEGSEPQKRLFGSAGYILELKQYTNPPTNNLHSLGNVQKVKEDNFESLSNTCQKSCVCGKPSTNIPDSAGYILELGQYNDESQNTCETNVINTDTQNQKTESKIKRQNFLINFVETNRNGFQSLSSSYKKTSCECNNKDSPGYIIELEQGKNVITNENTNNTSQKKKCDCEESRKRLSSSAGYVLELDQYKHEAVNKTRKLSKTIFELQNNAVDTLTNECQLKNCDNRKRLSSSAGYILELDQYKHDPMNRTQKLSTNLFDVQRNTIESLNNTNLKKSYEGSEPQKRLFGSAGYILELKQYTNRPTNNSHSLGNIQKVKEDNFESLSNTCQKSRVCGKPSTIISDSAGYILELGQYNDESQNTCETNVFNTDTQNQKTESKIKRQNFLINFVETNRNGFQSLSSSYKKTSCECNNKDSPGYIIELEQGKNVITNENTNNTSQKKKCDCEESRKRLSSSAGYILELDQYKHEAVNKTRKLNKTIFELQNNAVETLTNECQLKNCDNRKRLSSSAGYILELDQYQHEPLNKTRKLSKNVFDVHRNTIESLNNTNLKKSYEGSEPQKRLFGSAGYILELQQYTNRPTNTSHRLSNIQEVKGDTIESLNNTCQKNCVCKKPSTIISDPPGYILELDQYNNDSLNTTNKLGKNIFEIQKNTIESLNNTNKKKSCRCREGHELLSESAASIDDLNNCKQELTTKTHKLSKNIFGIQKDAIESLTNPNQKNSCGCSDARKRLSASAGYILELEQFKNKLIAASKELPKPIENPSKISNHTCQKGCVCRKPSKIISDPPGYIIDLDQYKQEQAKNKHDKCKCSQENKPLSDSASELQQIARQLTNTPKKISKDIPEITNTTCQKSCVCRKPSRIISDPPGYVLELEQYKQERVKNENNKCKCSQEKKKPLDSALELQEVARQLSNFPKKINKDMHEIKTNTTCQKSCVCRKPSQVISDPPGYVYELKQYKHEQIKNEDNTCKCREQKTKSSDSALDLQQTARQLSNTSKNIRKDSHEIKANTTCQKSCVCRKPSQIISDPPGYILDLEKYNQESTNKTHIVGKNIFEIQRNTIETLNNANQNNRCACSDSRKRHSSAGYILDLQQNARGRLNTTLRLNKNTQEQILGKNNFEIQRSTVETLNDANQKNSGACNESRKRFSSSAGYILELEQYKKEAQANADDETCQCKDSSKNTFDPIACRVGDIKPNENRFKRNIYEAPINPTDVSDSCNCSEPLGNPFESPDKLYSEFSKIQGPTKNALEVCKNIFGTHMNTYDELDHSNQKPCCDYLSDEQKNTKETLNDPAETCNCNQTEKYKLEIPKTTNVTLNDAKDTFNFNQTSKSKFDLPEFLISLHKYVPTKNILEMCKSILDKQDNLNEKHESSKKVQDENPKTKNEYTITAQGNKLESQKNTFDLCNQLGAPNSAIQTLKNIYLPPRYTLEYTKNYEYPANNIPIDQPVKEVHSVKVSYSHTENTGTAMLSAEVMDLPYTEFHDSLAHKQEDITEEANNLTKYDIFKRIKEAYKACSCKVCECIIGKSPTKNQICKCKPCECRDCTSYLDKMNYKSPTAPISISHGSNSSRVRCSKGHYKGVEQRQPCDCKPCDCVKCTHLTQLCDCEPCQCAFCVSQKKVHKPRTLVVAPVGESVQRVSCTCSPCDCIECGQGFPATSRMTNEMSTATNRHALCRCEVCLNEHCEHGGVDFCRCERQKGVINKPVEKDTRDYDIRTASVVYKSQIKKDKNKLCSRHDTIAMFAALPYTFPTFAANNKPNTTKTCSCEECECVSCVCRENAINIIKSSNFFPSNKSLKSKLNSPQNCNCSKCECEICDKYLYDQHNDRNVSKQHKKNCVCNVCDCINCAGESRDIKYSFNGLCQCSTCQCTDCEIKMISGIEHKYQCSKCRNENCFGDKCASNQVVHPIKRGELLTPSTHRSKVQSLMLEKQHRALPIHSNKCDTLKCDTWHCIKCQERNRGKSFPKNNSIGDKISGSAFSGYSSFETSPKTSCHKDYVSLTPISQNKNQSCESSCNSSGHDYPEYLIQFPKSTVETCLKDVMKLNMDKTIALDKFNIVPKKSSVKYQADSMSNEFMSERDNSSQSHGCNLISSCDCNTVTAKCSETINQYHNISNSCMVNNRSAPYILWEPDFIESTSCRNCKFEIENNNRPGAFDSLQTSELSHQNCSGCIEESTSSITVTGCETKTETRKCFHILQNFNDVHVASKMLESNTSEQKPANTLFEIRNEECCTWKYSKPQGNKGGDDDTLNSDEDYTRVQKTLKKAKEYNAELMQMLQMYEKANEEFESISDKLKIPQILVSKDVVEIEHELQEIPLEALSVREVLTSTSILQESIKPDRTFAECENDFNIITKKNGRTELTIISDHQTCNLPKGECDITNELSTANEIIPLKRNEIYLEKSELSFVNKNVPIEQNETYTDKAGIEETGNNSKDSVRIKKSIDTKTKDKRLINDTKGSTLDCRRIKKKDRINSKNYKKYSKLLKRTIIISKRITLNNSNLNTSNPIVKCCVTEGTSAAEINSNCNNEKSFCIPVNNTEKESNDSYGYNSQRKCRENVILRKLDSVYGSEEISVSTSDNYGLESDFMSLNESESSSMAQENEEIKPWPILKKNYYNSKPNTKNKGVCIFPSLELQIKQAVQSISLQTSSTINPKKKSIVRHHENKALEKLQDEVKKLLDMPILQQQTASKSDNTKESLNIQPKNKLELELKETPGISFQTSWKDMKSVDKEVWCSFTREAVESLIKDLLHLSVMRPLEKRTDVVNATTDNNENNRKSPIIVTPKCSCDALKVGFLGVRRVSDHTVLVKWNVPQKLAMVHGYELLVDGRAVQKIFSPTKSMAVVTCLPHTDKVLLTIRTITSSLSVSGHYPTTTIIYRPRAKY